MAGADSGYSADGALQSALLPATIPSTQQNFEGLSNQDNFNIFGGRVNPPDPIGDVGPNHYVEMVNLVFAVYDKTGNLLLGPVDTGTLWAASRSPTARTRRATRSSSTTRSADRWILIAVHDERPGRSEQAVLELRRGLDDGRSDRVATTATPSRRALPVLPRLPEVRRLDGLVRPHDARVRPDGRVRHRRLRAREEQDGQRPAGPGRELLPRRQRPGHPAARRRRAAAGRHRRQAEAEDRRGDPDRRDAGRQRRRLRRDVRRAEHLGPRREVAARRRPRR